MPAIQLSKDDGLVTPRCVEGCNDPDPDPDAVGYFLPGLENQFAHCSDGDIDLDQDGLDDGCELALALAFAPQMSFAYGDDVNREPRWAAQWLDGDPGSYTVRIAYLHSYWMDMGDGGTSGGFACAGGFLAGYPCDEGHAGDSEWIRLDVKYNPANNHWFLADAKYSAHTWHVDFSRRASDSALYVSASSDGGGGHLFRNYMEYPDKRGGFPRAYAADRKHANYPTEAYCDGPGGAGGADDCTHPRYLTRLTVSPGANLGSRHAPFLDCVATTRTDHPAYGLGRQECYWTNTPSPGQFRGWFPVAGTTKGSSAYNGILSTHFGF